MARSGVGPLAYVAGGAIALSVFALIGYLYTRPVAPPPAPPPVVAPASPSTPAQIAAAADAAPADPAAWARLCAATAKNYWRDTSPADCDKAVELQPAAIPPRLDRAYMQMKVGKSADAVAGFEAVLAKEPANPAALFGRSLMKVQAKDLAGSAVDRKRALAADPDIVLTLEEAYDFKVPWDYRR